MPGYCMPVREKETSCPAKRTSCSAGITDSPCKKPAKDNTGNEDSNCYLNCPLCYVMTLTGTGQAGRSPCSIAKDYPQYQSTYDYIYYSAAWKPPDGC